jgi:16S rRNA A1518/A1519 N6-dimethyltransferase RsmA/KsgA/DIM1 with predicted DNA glycosylase/AP lyase activity
MVKYKQKINFAELIAGTNRMPFVLSAALPYEISTFIIDWLQTNRITAQEKLCKS